MIIQFNTGKTINGNNESSAPFIAMVEGELSRFSQYITRIEVHLSDENGGKDGQNDKRCMIEARLEGKQPIAVTADADTHEQSVELAISKLKNSLETIFGRLKNY